MAPAVWAAVLIDDEQACTDGPMEGTGVRKSVGGVAAGVAVGWLGDAGPSIPDLADPRLGGPCKVFCVRVNGGQVLELN